VTFRPHPLVRVAGSVSVLALAAFGEAISLAFGLALLLLLGGLGGVMRRQIRIVAAVAMPLFIVLAAVWGLYLQTPPGGLLGSDPAGGFLHAAGLAFRVAVVGTGAQALWLSIQSDEVPTVLVSLGVRGDPLILALSVLGVFQLANQLLHQMHLALIIRGALNPKSIISRTRALPSLLLNLWTPVLKLSFDRISTKTGPLDFYGIVNMPTDRYESISTHNAAVLLFAAVIAALPFVPIAQFITITQ
jgi:hypothetical protein